MFITLVKLFFSLNTLFYFIMHSRVFSFHLTVRLFSNTSPQKRRAQNSLQFKQTWKKKQRNDEQGAAHAAAGLSGRPDNTALVQEIQQEEDHLAVPCVWSSFEILSQCINSIRYDCKWHQPIRECQNLRTERFDLPSRYEQQMFLLHTRCR